MILSAAGLSKAYRNGNASLPVLTNVSLDVARGELVVITGSSGCGKTTLLNVLGTLDRPDAGRLVIDGIDCGAMGEEEFSRFRSHRIGFVFQFHHLLTEFTALENLEIPQRIAGRPWPEARARAEEWLARVGLSHRRNHRPSALSGGERQRVAVARALVNNPPLLLADEPTGNLDRESGAMVLQAMVEMCQSCGAAMVLVTHDDRVASVANRRLVLLDGVICPGGPEIGLEKGGVGP